MWAETLPKEAPGGREGQAYHSNASGTACSRGAKTHRPSHNAVTRGLVVVQRDGHLAQVKVTPPTHSQQDPEHLVICEEPEEPDELDEEEEEEEEEVEEAGEAQAEEVQETRGRMPSEAELPASQVSLVPQAPLPSPARAGLGQNLLTLSSFNLKPSNVEASDAGLVDADGEGLECRIYAAPVPLPNLMDSVLLLEAKVPLRTSGKNIFRTFPPDIWLDITGNNTALGTRCLFASRRHENSVLGTVEKFLQIPSAAKEEQLPIIAPQSVITQMGDKEQQAWILQIHPGDELLRVIVRPGALLHRMLRRGAVLPAARFVWRLRDTNDVQEEVKTTASVGDFSILSNLEDPATEQPPNFTSHPLRPEQLRSLGWMLGQVRNHS
ncbi:unnamed protein product [Cladocopium goreaui]|uniref:E3 ubiquitin-protein ligase SHPRH n=1 Tax=Cladocopium goreaui TaxID=2562237 RepID=A0A9P1CI55_9DINO|nr:unnamed protein product [Cladocopium goreaui]